MTSSTTLALGQTSYQLLDTLQRDIGEDPEKKANNNVFARGNFEDLKVDLGSGRDTLNIVGNVTGASILLDERDTHDGKTEGANQGNDLLLISGNLTASLESFGKDTISPEQQNRNQVWTGGGNDTVRIRGIVEDTDFHLGSGNDSLVIGDNATRVYVGTESGRDYVEFRGLATDVIVNTGSDSDTVVFRNTLSGSGSDYKSSNIKTTAAVDLGTGNDSLILANGADNSDITTGSGLDTVRLTGVFENVWFQLDGADSLGGGDLSGGDLITASSGSRFFDTTFSSKNVEGDTLLVGTNTIWGDSNIYFGSGADSIVFGSGTLIYDSTISLGAGADTLVFGSGTLFNNFLIDLGSDDDQDLIRFSNYTDLAGVTIGGAGSGDVLFIGANQYFYSTGDGTSLFTSAQDTGSYDTWMNDWFKNT